VTALVVVVLDLSEDSREFVDVTGMLTYFLCGICCSCAIVNIILCPVPMPLGPFACHSFCHSICLCRFTAKVIIWFHWNLMSWLGLPVRRTD